MVKHTLKSCCVNIAKFSKYVWPFYNIMDEMVNWKQSRIQPYSPAVLVMSYLLKEYPS